MSKIYVFDYSVTATTQVAIKAESLRQAEAYLEDGIWNEPDMASATALNDSLVYGQPSYECTEVADELEGYDEDDYYDATNCGIGVDGELIEE